MTSTFYIKSATDIDGISSASVGTIAALLVDFSRNRLFHRKLAVGAKEHAHGGCHLRRKGGGFVTLARAPPASFLTLLSAEDVAIVRLLAFAIGVQWCGSVPQLPKSGGCLPFVCIKRAGKVEKSCINAGIPINGLKDLITCCILSFVWTNTAEHW
jgi:hypothetical protein